MIPPENMAVLIGSIVMMAMGIYYYRKLRQEEIQVPRPVESNPTPMAQLNQIQVPSPSPPPHPSYPSSLEKDLKTLKLLGITPRRPEPEAPKPQPAPTPKTIWDLPSQEIWICGECGRRITTIERIRVYKPGIGLIEVPRCPYPDCGAPLAPYKVIEPEEPKTQAMRTIELGELPAPSREARGLGIENPMIKEEESEEGEGEGEEA